MTSPLTHTLHKVQDKLLELYNEQGSPALVFHDYRRALAVDELISDIGDDIGLDGFRPEVSTARLAHWFLCMGRILDYGNAAQVGQGLVRKWLDQPAFVAAVLQTMQQVEARATPQTDADALLHDASLAYWATSNYENLSPLMRLEEEALGGREYSLADWEAEQYQRLASAKFHTEYGKLHFAPLLHQNVLEQKQRSEKLQQKTRKRLQREKGLGVPKFRGLEPKVPQRANQTYFRAVYRNHIQLSAIADNKANMMTGINAILLSVLVSILSYTNTIHEKPELSMPVAIFLVTALVSLICAVASASPRVTKRNKPGVPQAVSRKNLAFFGNFTQMGLEEFEEAMDSLLRNDELVYGSMTRDLYFLGKVLDKKFRYLRLSYHIFLGGFVLSVLLFAYIAFS